MLRSPPVLKSLALLALLLLAVGMISPLLTLTRFWVFDEQVSILTGIYQLWRQGQYGLFGLIFLLSVCLPLAKLTLLFYLLHQLARKRRSPGVRLGRMLHWIHDYGRWAMLDVMVVAMLLVTVKLGVVISVQVHYGLYLFAVGVLLTMLVTRQTVLVLESGGEVQPPDSI